MTKSIRALLVGAALTGFVAGTNAVAQDTSGKDDKQSTATHSGKKATKKVNKEKHACKGQNSCKGLGAGGKNECKGKGACRTDGKKPNS